MLAVLKAVSWDARTVGRWADHLVDSKELLRGVRTEPETAAWWEQTWADLMAVLWVAMTAVQKDETSVAHLAVLMAASRVVKMVVRLAGLWAVDSVASRVA